MFMLSFIFVAVCGFLSGSESVQVFVLSFVYICIAAGDPVIKREGWDPINWNNLTTFLPVPNQNLDFQCHMSWSFLCSVS